MPLTYLNVDAESLVKAKTNYTSLRNPQISQRDPDGLQIAIEYSLTLLVLEPEHIEKIKSPHFIKTMATHERHIIKDHSYYHWLDTQHHCSDSTTSLASGLLVDCLVKTIQAAHHRFNKAPDETRISCVEAPKIYTRALMVEQGQQTWFMLFTPVKGGVDDFQSLETFDSFMDVMRNSYRNFISSSAND